MYASYVPKQKSDFILMNTVHQCIEDYFFEERANTSANTKWHENCITNYDFTFQFPIDICQYALFYVLDYSWNSFSECKNVFEQNELYWPNAQLDFPDKVSVCVKWNGFWPNHVLTYNINHSLRSIKTTATSIRN